MDAGEQPRVGADPGEDERVGLGAREAKLRRGDHADRSVRDQPREHRRRIDEAQDDDRDAGGDLLKGFAQDGREGALLGVLEVVDDPDRLRWQQGEEAAEEAAREYREIDVAFGRQARQPRSPGSRQRRRELADEVEEGRRVGVAGIDLVPERRRLARFAVARRERRLSRARRGGRPGDRCCRPRELLEQALAREDAGDARPSELRHAEAA